MVLVIRPTGQITAAPGPAAPPDERELFSIGRGKRPSATVLVVDDEPLILWSLSEALSDAGYRPLGAPDAATALRLVTADDAPAVVFLDLRLPDSRDLGLLRSLRRLCPQTRIVLMTAHGSPELAAEALDLGAFRVVDKPFDVSAMMTIVREALPDRPM